jgi:transposase-like protein
MMDEVDDSDLDQAVLVTAAEVVCPYCASTNEIRLDPSGGAIQDYVEDCEVCCRPWRVSVRCDDDGGIGVEVEPAD